MSGHSKWSTIKRKKGAADAKRGKIFTKLIREIATAARMGGGENRTPTRACAWPSKRRAPSNMPKDNIVRAIKKGTGAGRGRGLRGGRLRGLRARRCTAIYVEVLTDNKNRSVGDVRHILTKNGGNLGASGCVAYLFEKRGLLSFVASEVDADALMEAALDGGADDLIETGDSLIVVVSPSVFESLKAALVAAGFALEHAEIAMEASSTIAIEGVQAESMLRLADALEELDDVQNVFANFDISDAEMVRLAG